MSSKEKFDGNKSFQTEFSKHCLPHCSFSLRDSSLDWFKAPKNSLVNPLEFPVLANSGSKLYSIANQYCSNNLQSIDFSS